MTLECAYRECKYTSSQVPLNNFIHFLTESLKLWTQNCEREQILKYIKQQHQQYFECPQHIDSIPHNERHITQTNKAQSDSNKNSDVPINNLYQICYNESLEEVFNSKGCEVKLIEKVDLLMPIEVYYVVKMPKTIYLKCYNKIESYYKLVVTSVKASIKFRRYFNLGKNVCYNRCDERIEKYKIEQFAVKDCSDKLLENNNFVSWKFASKEKLNKHSIAKMDSKVKMNNDYINIRCDICNDHFESLKTYKSHYEACVFVEKAKNEIDSPSHLCNFCGKCFSTPTRLRGHKLVHLRKPESKLYKCDSCEKSFRSRICLEDHINQHAGIKPYECKLCGKSFGTMIRLEQHKISHSDIRYNCSICNATFNRKGNLAVHVKRHATKDGMYTCSVCEQKYSSMGELKIHRKIHSLDDILENAEKNPKRKLLQCKICDKICSNHSQLTIHESTHTAKRITFDCDECGKKLASKHSLTYHKHSFHSLVKPHMCQYCGDSFVSKELRLVHERKHTGERPFECSICNKRFRCPNVLNVHLKTHYTERSHVCHYCKKTFARKGTLAIHERIHTGVKPYSCAICNRSFAQRYDMIKHMKTHKNKSINCEQCNKTFQTSDDIIKHLEYHNALEAPKEVHVEN